MICSTNCPIGQFIDITKVNMCSLCDNGCASCSITSDNCDKCNTFNSIPYYRDALILTCSPVCLIGQFINNQLQNQCSLCDLGCAVCLGISSNCSSCINGYYLNYNSLTCTINCPAGQFIDNTLINKCSLCDVGCAICEVKSSNCSQCTTIGGVQYDLHYNTTLCLTSCPVGQFSNKNIENTCSLCDVGCSICQISSSTCL